MNELERISTSIRAVKPELARKYHVREIGVFGSHARGEERPGSDLDILVEFERPLDLFRFLDLEEELSVITGKKVDLVSKKALKPHIGREILNQVRLI